jgi:hypothetical protein
MLAAFASPSTVPLGVRQRPGGGVSPEGGTAQRSGMPVVPYSRPSRFSEGCVDFADLLEFILEVPASSCSTTTRKMHAAYVEVGSCPSAILILINYNKPCKRPIILLDGFFWGQCMGG